MRELLERFVAAFLRGIDGEVAAMRASAGAFEVALTDGQELGGSRYAFALPGGAADRVIAGAIATLRAGTDEQSATIERVIVDENRVVLVAAQALDLTGDIALVIAPWFLYDRLRAALERLAPVTHGVELALALFAREAGDAAASTTAPTPLRRDHGALDASQRAAVALCAERPIAFVWGPPGTGKTVTLTHVLEELLARDERVLLVSTTNAAIDEVLAKLSPRPWFAAMVDAGEAIRLGRSQAETFGAELTDVVARRHDAHTRARQALRARIAEVEPLARHAAALIAELEAAAAPQRSLFGEPPRLRPAAIERLFGAGTGEAFVAREPAVQQDVIARRLARLERLRSAARARLAAHAAADRDLEARVVAGARLVMCTSTTAYLSPLLQDERFDVLVAEEAGMATLPSLFYAACLCRARAVMVGDPRQLPPIVQSDDERVRRAIGRSIFDVAVPTPEASPRVAMLTNQYRMHRAIGSLVGRLFYADRLVHRADTATSPRSRRARRFPARRPCSSTPLGAPPASARRRERRGSTGGPPRSWSTSPTRRSARARRRSP
jgi:hypothetical protein